MAGVEALAVAPGIPGLEAQEKRDRVPAGTYQRLYDGGRLSVAEGLRVQPPADLWDKVCRDWGTPQHIVVDRFKLAELQDVVDLGTHVEPRIAQYSYQTFDIRALRRLTKDGPFSVETDSRALLATSLSQGKVVNDTSGNVKLVKRHTTANSARDDVAAALVLTAGAYARAKAAGDSAGPEYRGMI